MSNSAKIREASHAGSWYLENSQALDQQLDGWLDDISDFRGIGTLSADQVNEKRFPSTKEGQLYPIQNARVIIAPHAGYSYSGRAASYAYRCLDLSKKKRIFLLGPSHHWYLGKAALTQCSVYKTPLGDINVDVNMTEELTRTGGGLFQKMPLDVDEAEHSLEMHLPYIYKCIQRHTSTNTQTPLLVPILVGSTDAKTEKLLGGLLAPYLADAENAFVISSDFMHWGLRFRYTAYGNDVGSLRNLHKSDRIGSNDLPIYESIEKIDRACLDVCETGDYDEWQNVLEKTGNTICGRHPIGVILAAMEEVKKTKASIDGQFQFVRYERSSDVISTSDSSVSYCSAFAVL